MRLLPLCLIGLFLVSCREQEAPKDGSGLEGSLWVSREIDNIGEEVRQGFRFQDGDCEWIIYNPAGETKVLEELKYTVVSDVITFSSPEGMALYTGKLSENRSSFTIDEGGEDRVEFVRQNDQVEQEGADQPTTAPESRVEGDPKPK